jgi:hypothetical protein
MSALHALLLNIQTAIVQIQWIESRNLAPKVNLMVKHQPAQAKKLKIIVDEQGRTVVVLSINILLLIFLFPLLLLFRILFRLHRPQCCRSLPWFFPLLLGRGTHRRYLLFHPIRVILMTYLITPLIWTSFEVLFVIIRMLSSLSAS